MKLFSRFIVPCLVLALALAGCQDRTSAPFEAGTDQQAVLAGAGAVGLERAIAAQEQHNPRLLALADVVGTAVGLAPDGTPAVLVLTKAPGVAGIPKSLDGVPVVVKVTGEIRALIKPENPGKPDKPDGGGKGKEKINPKGKFDPPVPIGVSTGNEGECSAGTIGCRVAGGGKVYALSNNHVYALENEAPLGSNVLQPGLYDARCNIRRCNVIGTLFDFEGIVFFDPDNPPEQIPTNTIDAAIALSSTELLGNATPSNGYGTPKSVTVPAEFHQMVQKYGRTTILTKGKVDGINATVDVSYNSGRTARFVNQIVVLGSNGSFIKAGDSGSLLVTDPDRNPVGLLFAGDPSGIWAVANPIDAVLDRFGVTVDDIK